MDEIVDLVLVNHTFLGEQWTQGHELMCGSHPAVDADCSCASCPPPPPRGPPALPLGASCFISAVTSLLLCLAQTFPTLEIKQSSGKPIFYFRFSFGLVCEPYGGHTHVSSSSCLWLHSCMTSRALNQRGYITQLLPLVHCMPGGLQSCDRSPTFICLGESKVFLWLLEHDWLL